MCIRDRLYGDAGADTITGYTYAEYGAPAVYGGLDNDAITIWATGEGHGDEGNDTLAGWGTLYGETGNDALYIGDQGTAYGGDQNDYLRGWAPYSWWDGAQTLYGGMGDDTLQGDQIGVNAGALIPTVGETTDTTSNDTLYGGDGSDTAVFLDRRDHYTVVNNGDGTIGVIANWTSEGTDRLTDIETIAFTDITICLLYTYRCV